MDIFNSKPRKLLCVSNKNHGWTDSDENAHLLTVGSTYTMIGAEVHRWHTNVLLEEFPGVKFNSSCFEECEE